MPSDAVLDTTLYVRHDLSPAVRRNTQFIQTRANVGRLAAHLLVYDRVWIPTKDMAVAAALVRWCGRELAVELLKERAVGFVHVPDMLGYVGNGGGLHTFSVGPGERELGWYQAALFGSPQEALDLQLQHLSDLAPRHRRQMLSAAWPALRPLTPAPGEVDRAVLNES